MNSDKLIEVTEVHYSCILEEIEKLRRNLASLQKLQADTMNQVIRKNQIIYKERECFHFLERAIERSFGDDGIQKIYGMYNQIKEESGMTYELSYQMPTDN